MAVSLVFDLIAGDPRWFPHPVRFIGWLCIFYALSHGAVVLVAPLAGLYPIIVLILVRSHVVSVATLTKFRQRLLQNGNGEALEQMLDTIIRRVLQNVGVN